MIGGNTSESSNRAVQAARGYLRRPDLVLATLKALDRMALRLTPGYIPDAGLDAAAELYGDYVAAGGRNVVIPAAERDLMTHDLISRELLRSQRKGWLGRSDGSAFGSLTEVQIAHRALPAIGDFAGHHFGIWREPAGFWLRRFGQHWISSAHANWLDPVAALREATDIVIEALHLLPGDATSGAGRRPHDEPSARQNQTTQPAPAAAAT